MSYQLLRYMTSTVGLIVAVDGDDADVMAAEWTSFAAWDPLHIAVGIQKSNLTHDLILARGEFSVTLCDAGQAALANFCGSFSGRDIDKTTSGLLELKPPVVLRTPHVAGGVLNAECTLAQVVDLPGYSLFIGEAVWVQIDESAALDPLVKHGRMHGLGAELIDEQVLVGGRVLAPGVLAVAATSRALEAGIGRWSIRVSAAGQLLVAESLDVDGDLLQDVSYDALVVADHEVLCVEVRAPNGACGVAHVRSVVGARSGVEKLVEPSGR